MRKIDRILETIEKIKASESFALECLKKHNLNCRIYIACVESWVRCAEFAISDAATTDAVKIAAVAKWPSCMRMCFKSIQNQEAYLYASTFHYEAAKILVKSNSAYVRSGCARFKDLAWLLKNDIDPIVRASACIWPEVAKYLEDDRDYSVILARINLLETASLEKYSKDVNSFIRMACANRWLSSAMELIDDWDPNVKMAAFKKLEKHGYNPTLIQKNSKVAKGKPLTTSF